MSLAKLLLLKLSDLAYGQDIFPMFVQYLYLFPVNFRNFLSVVLYHNIWKEYD